MTHLEIRRAVPEDAPVVRAARERAIRVSAVGYYDADAIDAWAGGGSEDEGGWAGPGRSAAGESRARTRRPCVRRPG